jgi:tetratricopeptide (TPR) repeat protein
MNLEVFSCLSGMAVLHRGYANREVIDVQVRAQELWERLGRPAEFIGVIRDRWMFHFCRSETKFAQNLAENLLQSSQEQIDPRYTIWGHALVGGSAMIRGELLDASLHLQEGLRLMRSCSNDPSYLWRSQKTMRGPWTAWAHATTWLGYVKCWLGYPDQALAYLSSVVERAPMMDWAPALVAYSTLEVQARSFFTDGLELVPRIRALSKRIGELDLALYNSMATIYWGYATSCCEDPEGGIAVMHEGMEAYRASETVIWSGYHRALFAEAYRRLGRLREARQLLTEAQDLAERTGERWYDAELVRRLGEVDRRQGNVWAAERRFKQALAISRRQHAKLWELHAATSLARLYHEQHRSAEARAVLAPVYDWFREGSQTASLRRAKALLDELDRLPSIRCN